MFCLLVNKNFKNELYLNSIDFNFKIIAILISYCLKINFFNTFFNDMYKKYVKIFNKAGEKKKLAWNIFKSLK